MDITELWKPEYSVGHKEIDEQHRYLFELWILLDSVKDQENNTRSLEQALLSLFDYVELHFGKEEKYLQDHPEIEQHRKVHADFIAQCETFMRQFRQSTLDTRAVVDYLSTWLIEHIVQMDRRYFRELEKQS